MVLLCVVVTVVRGFSFYRMRYCYAIGAYILVCYADGTAALL